MKIRRKFGLKRIAEIKGLLDDGCNVDEIAAYYRVNMSLAYALMDCARGVR